MEAINFYLLQLQLVTIIETVTFRTFSSPAPSILLQLITFKCNFFSALFKIATKLLT